jgi:hypothetical protein
MLTFQQFLEMQSHKGKPGYCLYCGKPTHQDPDIVSFCSKECENDYYEEEEMKQFDKETGYKYDGGVRRKAKIAVEPGEPEETPRLEPAPWNFK